MRIFVQVLKDYEGRIIGEDMRAYPLIKGAKISLPEKMAKILIKAGWAERIESIEQR